MPFLTDSPPMAAVRGSAVGMPISKRLLEWLYEPLWRLAGRKSRGRIRHPRWAWHEPCPI